MTEESTAVAGPNLNLLKWGMYLNLGLMLLILSQAMTGIGRVAGGMYTFEGWELGTSHKRTAEIGILLALVMLVLVAKSGLAKENKLKGMSIGIFAMWIIQFGLGEMITSGTGWLAMVHVPLALMMFTHGAMMMPKFKAELGGE